MFSLQKPIFLWISLVVINSIGFPQPPTQNTQNFYIKRDKGKFITEWRVEYSATDTMVFSDLNGELIQLRHPCKRGITSLPKRSILIFLSLMILKRLFLRELTAQAQAMVWDIIL